MSRDHWPHEEDGQAPAEETAKKDTFWTLRPKPVSDEEFIEQLRKSSESARRWRWMVPVVIVFLIVAIWNKRPVFQVPGPVAAGGMVFNLQELLFLVSLAAVVGVGFGLKVGHFLQMSAELFWGDRRTDLLIRYHDLLNEHNILPNPQTQDTT